MSKYNRHKNRISKADPLYGTGTSIVTPNRPQNLSTYISPVQLNRLRVDVRMWREAIAEAEYAYYPYRVKMQQIFIDTILNGHVAALVERRQDLTMLREFEVLDKAGKVSQVLTEQLEESEWFEHFQLYTLDAEMFGYSLISLGDIKDDQFTDIGIVRRWCVSPDRKEATRFIYDPQGQKWDDEPFKNWHVYVKTRSENGVSPCGYGLFYKIALYEIFLRNTLGFNGDFVELYSQPYRVGKTTKTTESERAELEQALKNMGSSGYAIIDPMDEITFLETALGGTGYKGYESLEARCQAVVSKLILGHADAIDSIPGKLGSGQGDKDASPVAMALADKQSKDGKKLQRITTNDLFPKIAALGLKGYDGASFRYKNDSELQETRQKEDAANLQTAQIALAMKNAGLKMDAKYYQERTGIITSDAPDPVAPPIPGEGDKKPVAGDRVKNRLRNLYK